MSVRTSDYPPKPLPGHVIVNLVLAAAIWCIGVVLTAQSLPIGRSVLKGDNNAISAEVAQVRQELEAPEPPARTIVVDGKRTIAL